MLSDATGSAHCAVSNWPTPALLADRVAAAPNEAADAADAEEKPGKLKALAVWGADAGRSVFVDIAPAATLKGSMGCLSTATAASAALRPSRDVSRSSPREWHHSRRRAGRHDAYEPVS